MRYAPPVCAMRRHAVECATQLFFGKIEIQKSKRQKCDLEFFSFEKNVCKIKVGRPTPRSVMEEWIRSIEMSCVAPRLPHNSVRNLFFVASSSYEEVEPPVARRTSSVSVVGSISNCRGTMTPTRTAASRTEVAPCRVLNCERMASHSCTRRNIEPALP